MIKWYVKNKKTNLFYEYKQDLEKIDKNFVTLEQILKLNKNVEIKEFYVGRPSICGNPYSHLNNTLAKFKVKTIEEAITNYEEFYLPTIENEILRIKKEILAIQNCLVKNDLTQLVICLSCFCVPKKCHAIPLLRKIIND